MAVSEDDVASLLSGPVTEDDVASLLAEPAAAPVTPGADPVAARADLANDPESVSRKLHAALDSTGAVPPEFEPPRQAEEDKSELMRSMQRATWKYQLEQRAKELRLARESKVPVEVVSADYDAFKASFDGSRYDWNGWRKDNPELAKMGDEDQSLLPLVLREEQISTFAKAVRGIYRLQAYDEEQRVETRKAMRTGQPEVKIKRPDMFNAPDVLMRDDPAANLGTYDKVVSAKAKADRGVERSKMGATLAWRMATGQDTTELEAQIAEAGKGLEPTYMNASPAQQVLIDAANIVPSLVEGVKARGVGGAVGGAVGAAAGYLVGKGKGAAELGMLGMNWGQRVAAGGGSFRLEMGGALIDMLGEKTEDGQPVDRKIALGSAIAYGVVAGIIESAGEHEVSMFGPMGDAIRKGSGKAFLKGMIKNPNFRKVFKDIALRYAKGVAGEVGEEVSQQGAQDLFDYVTRSLTAGKLQTPDVEHELVGLAETGVSTLKGMAALAPGIAVQNVAQQLGGQRLARVYGAFVDRADAAKGGQLVKATLKLADSPTTQAAPAAVAKMIADTTGESGEPVTHLYVGPDEFTRYFQGQDEDVNKAAEQLLGPDGPRVLQEALATGSKLEVPMADYLEKWGATPAAKALEEDTTTSRTARTSRQLKEEAKQDEASIKEQAEQIAKEEEHPANPTAEQRLGEHLVRQLAATGTQSVKDARTAVALWRAMVRTQATRAGESADELFGDYLVEVQKGDNASESPAGTLAQPAKPPAASDALTTRVTGNVDEELGPLSDEDKATERYIDPVSGLRNLDAWEATPRTPGKKVGVLTIIDAKAVNDSVLGGHDTTNALLRTAAPVVAGIDPAAARQGTNYVFETDGQVGLDDAVSRVQAALPKGFRVEGATADSFKQAMWKLDTGTDEKRKKGTLLPRGKSAVDLSTLPQLEEKFAKEPVRTTLPDALVKKAGEASPEQHFTDVYLDKVVPGVLSRAGFEASPPAAFVASIDGIGVGALNKKHVAERKAGDAFIELVSQVAKDLGGAAFSFAHMSGDEWAAKHDDKAELQAFLDDLRDALREKSKLLQFGDRTFPIKAAVRSAIGEKTYGAADRALNKAKLAEAGTRDDAGRVRQDGRGKSAPAATGDGRTAAQRDALLAERRARIERRGTAGQAFVHRSGSGSEGADARGAGSAPAADGGRAGQQLERPWSDAGMVEAREAVGRMRDAEKKALATAWLDHVEGKLAEQPRLPLEMQKKFDNEGLVPPGYVPSYEEDGRSMERRLPGKRSHSDQPAELKRLNLLEKDSNLGDMSSVGNKRTRYEQDTDVAGPRGYTDIAGSGLRRMFKIALNKNADLSTFLHESAHVFLETFGDLAERPEAPASVRADFAEALKWMGVESRGDIRREHHEKWARTFEAYLLTGKAPSAKLAGAFARFHLWLKGIYRSIASLNADLSPEISGVFDRLLATDAEIARQKQAMGLQPMFRSPEEAGMTPEEWQGYLDAQEVATSNASRRAELRVLKDKLREAEGWWKREEKLERQQAEQDYEHLPARVAAQALRGKGPLVALPIPLLKSAVQAALGPAAAKAFLTSADGTHPDEVSDLGGFPTGKAMLQAIAALTDKAAWVKETAGTRMLEKHPDILSERDKLRDLVGQGLHGEYTAEWLLKEWNALRRKAGQGGAPVDAIKAAAKHIVEGRKVGRLNVGGTLQSERSAAEDAAKAAASGAYAQAAVFKQKQLLNMYLHRELTQAREAREAFVELAAKLSKDKARARLGKGGLVFRDGVDLLLESFGLKEPGQRESPLPSLNEVTAALETAGTTVMFDSEVLGRLLAQPDDWKTLTVSQLRELDAALKNIEGAARASSTALVDGKRVDKDLVVADLLKEAENLPHLGPSASSEDAKGLWRKFKGQIASIDADLLKPETMIRWLAGDDLKAAWFRAIILPLQKAKAAENDLLKATIKPIIQAFEAMPAAVRARSNEKVDGQALFPGHRQDIEPPTRRFELLAMALNSGNASNLQRLTEGRGITEDQLHRALDLLTADELAWVQSIWDGLETLWPASADLEERSTGLRPPKIQAQPLALKNGTLKGGYYPVVYHSAREAVGKQQQAQAVAALMDPTFTRPGTARGHLKARASKFAGAIDLRLSAISAHLAQAAHDIAYREALQSVGGLLIDDQVQGALTDRLGEERAATFMQWVKDVGQMRGASATAHAKGLTRLAMKFKGNSVIGVLGWSARTALGDFANLLAALPGSKFELKPKHWAAGLAQYALSPIEATRIAEEKSGELRTRRDQIQRELMGEIRKLTARGPLEHGPLAWMKEHAFTFMEWSDKATSTPIWLGGYRQALAAGESDADAVIAADALIRQLFPSHSPVDTAAIIRDKGFIGASLMFYGYMNVAYNNRRNIAHDIHLAEGAADTVKQTAKALAISLAFSATAMVLSEVFSGRGPEDEEDPEEWLLRKMVVSQFQDVPFGGTLAGAAENWWLGKRNNPRASPMLEAANSIGAAALALTDEEASTEKQLLAVLRAIGPVVGLPIAAPVRAGQYVSDVLDGDIEPEGPLDAASGLIYGKKP